MINISTEFTNYGYTFNRSLSSVIELPYNKSEVLLGVNELVNGYNFNSSVNKIQSNLMYLYSISKLANPDLPHLYEGFIGTSCDNCPNLEVSIRNFTPYSMAVQANDNENLNQMPYFYVSDEENNSFVIAYSYNGINPAIDDLPGTVITIDLTTGQYGGDLLAAIGTQQALSADFQVNTFRYNDVYGGTNAWPVFELSTYNSGGMFMGGQDFATYGSLISNEPFVDKLQQGIVVNEFKNFQNTNTQDIVTTSLDDNFNYLTSLSLAPGTLSGYESLFCVSLSTISALSAKPTSSLSADFTFVNVTSSVGVNNELGFLGLNGVAYGNNSIYVSDEGNNGVYKINVNGFVKDDNIRSFPIPKYYETEIIGGYGGVRDNYSFDNPKILQFYKDELYVYDQGNLCIKIYDGDLGFVRNIRKSAFAKNNPPAAIKLFKDQFYWLTTSGILHILDSDLNPITEIILYNFENSETYVDFIVNEEIDAMFVATKNNIYKYFFSNQEYIGRFNLTDNLIDNVDINFLAEAKIQEDQKLFAYVRNNNSGAILTFSEKNSYKNLLSDYDFDVYSIDEIQVDKNEFISNFSYNKSVIKLLSNNLQLKNFISNVVAVSLLRDGGIQYDGVKYFTDEDLAILDVEPSLDNYIGTNEIFSRSVANRVLEKIYDYQLNLLSLFKNQVTPPPSQVNILSPTLDGLMLEDFPGNANGYYRLETYDALTDDLVDDNSDIILLEDSVLKQQPVKVPEPPQPEPPVVVVEEPEECGCSKTINSDECMFADGNCSPPFDLIDLDNIYTVETISKEFVFPEDFPTGEPIYERSIVPGDSTEEDYTVTIDGVIKGYSSGWILIPMTSSDDDYYININGQRIKENGEQFNFTDLKDLTDEEYAIPYFEKQEKNSITGLKNAMADAGLPVVVDPTTMKSDETQGNSMDVTYKLDQSKDLGVSAYLSKNIDAVNYFGDVIDLGYKTFKTRNKNNGLVVDNNVFGMFLVPVPERFIGKWDYVGIDWTSYQYNITHVCDSVLQNNFFVYFDFVAVAGSNKIPPPELTKIELLDYFENPEKSTNQTYSLAYTNLNDRNDPIKVSADKKQLKFKDSRDEDINARFTINSGDAEFSDDGYYITGNSTVEITLSWDDDPGVAGRAIGSITILNTTWEITNNKKGSIKKEILLPAGFVVTGTVYDVNGCELYTLEQANADENTVRKGQSGGIIKPGVIIDAQDLKDLQDQLVHDPDYDLSVIGVQNSDGDGIINPFTGQSASQGSGGTSSINTKKDDTP